MSGQLFFRINQFFIRNPYVFFITLIATVSVLLLGFSKLNINEDIYSVFPQGKEFSKYNEILRENNLNKQVVFSFRVNEIPTDELKEKLENTANRLQNATKGYLKDFSVFKDAPENKVFDHLYNSLPAFVDSSEYAQLLPKLRPDSIEKALTGVYYKMISPNALFLRRFISKDPLGISWKYLSRINPQSDSASFQVEDGMIFSPDRSKVLFFAVLDFEMNDNFRNDALNGILEREATKINREENSGLDYFGTFQITHENSVQVKKDTWLTMVISISLILLILFVYYRSFVTPFFFVLPAVFGGLCGFGLIGYIRPDISGISLGTGAVLFGIILDYSFHFFTHLIHSNSLSDTVKELTFPMIVGSFTTVAAFAALMFTNSVVLQDFGLIALCCLSGASLFTLLILPPILHFCRYNVNRKTKAFRWNIRLPKWAVKFALFTIVVLTVIFLIKSRDAGFDDDLNNLSFHSEMLKEKEKELTGINPDTEKKIHFFASGKTEQEALEANFRLYGELQKFKEAHGLEELLSVAPFYIPESRTREGFNAWNAFWEEHRAGTLRQVNHIADSLGFSETAFEDFKAWISAGDIEKAGEGPELAKELGMSNLVYQTDNGWTIISSVVVKKESLPLLKQQLEDVPQVFAFDRSEMASSLLVTVKNDFNYLLLFSSLIVFVSLLLVYGRIELAVFAFLPMVISWIWILGISGIFDLKFNFVNIVIATFIFGLGDDFSIFVTDGLLQKYKHNTKVLRSYNAAIILSALTTIIGTGALIFAKHPAIHGIAVISVVGIGCILVVTLIVQPYLFNLFVSKRIAAKKVPLTGFMFVLTILLYIYFVLGCLFAHLVLGLVYLVPVAKVKKQRFMNAFASAFARSVMYAGFHLKKRIQYKERLDFSKPSIIIANHGSFLDILLLLMLHPKVIIMVKEWVYKSPFFGAIVRYSGYLYASEGPEKNLEMIRERMAQGYSIVIFPEGSRSGDGDIKRLHKGAFFLAETLQADIQPILIHGAYESVSKNDFLIKTSAITLKVLPKIKWDDPEYGTNYSQRTKEITKYMRKEYAMLRKELEKSAFLWPRIFYNFVFKGPVLEWYLKVKWSFEKKNFELYDELAGDRQKITDIGCGYGYLSYYLHYRDQQREILGIDHDEDKISIAAHGYDKTDNLRFEVADLNHWTFTPSDVFILNDVLHYLEAYKQAEVLEKLYEALLPGGIILIRDGITDLEGRHERTRLTEKFSTRLLKFNKASAPLNFFSSKDIVNFARNKNMTYKMIEQSPKTSNVLFILDKKN